MSRNNGFNMIYIPGFRCLVEIIKGFKRRKLTLFSKFSFLNLVVVEVKFVYSIDPASFVPNVYQQQSAQVQMEPYKEQQQQQQQMPHSSSSALSNCVVFMLNTVVKTLDCIGLAGQLEWFYQQQIEEIHNLDLLKNQIATKGSSGSSTFADVTTSQGAFVNVPDDLNRKDAIVQTDMLASTNINNQSVVSSLPLPTLIEDTDTSVNDDSSGSSMITYSENRTQDGGIPVVVEGLNDNAISIMPRVSLDMDRLFNSRIAPEHSSELLHVLLESEVAKELNSSTQQPIVDLQLPTTTTTTTTFNQPPSYPQRSTNTSHPLIVQRSTNLSQEEIIYIKLTSSFVSEPEQDDDDCVDLERMGHEIFNMIQNEASSGPFTRTPQTRVESAVPYDRQNEIIDLEAQQVVVLLQSQEQQQQQQSYLNPLGQPPSANYIVIPMAPVLTAPPGLLVPQAYYQGYPDYCQQLTHIYPININPYYSNLNQNAFNYMPNGANNLFNNSSYHSTLDNFTLALVRYIKLMLQGYRAETCVHMLCPKQHYTFGKNPIASGLNGGIYPVASLQDPNYFNFVIKRMLYRKQNRVNGDIDNIGSYGLNMIYNEICILGTSNHPNLLQLVDIYIYNNSIQIVMPRMLCDLNDMLTGGDVDDLMNEDLVIFIVLKVIKGLCYIYDLYGSFHGDLKTENIFISRWGEIKVADFGFVTRVGNEIQGHFGTMKAMAPEVADPHKTFNESADIWAIGILIIELLDRGHPTAEIETRTMLANSGNAFELLACRTSSPKSERDELIDPEFRDIIRSTLDLDPNRRPKIHELEESMTRLFERKATMNDADYQKSLYTYARRHTE
ncbi:kinase-like domain-containing protein [Cokeromyces recurvatus]|uniref:kinase-like domain-containing protein n=1 Tax=Cokeromyces recurvatus TaxID=90255 RepID=UPI00221E927C|nr:kinase-like domain-containing protein [Cokeromyces recurvatus]KAI7903061.1 kinase-like domain-containing protein [Cokeromyces recurvatus]